MNRKQKKGEKNMPTFWIIFWITSESPVAEDEQSLFFSLPFGISFFVCLLIWNTVFCSVWLWSCSVEVEVRVWKTVFWSGYTVWILGFVFFCLFFFLFFVEKRLGLFFIRVCVLFLCSWISGLVSESECFRHTVRFF